MSARRSVPCCQTSSSSCQARLRPRPPCMRAKREYQRSSQGSVSDFLASSPQKRHPRPTNSACTLKALTVRCSSPRRRFGHQKPSALRRTLRWIGTCSAVVATTSSAYAEGGNPFLLQQVHEIIRTQPADGTGTRWFALARPCIGMDVMPGMQGMFGARASAAASEPFSLWRDRPAAIETPLAKGAFPDPLFFVVNPVRNVLAVAAYRRCLELAPDHPQAAANLQTLGRGHR